MNDRRAVRENSPSEGRIDGWYLAGIDECRDIRFQHISTVLPPSDSFASNIN